MEILKKRLQLNTTQIQERYGSLDELYSKINDQEQENFSSIQEELSKHFGMIKKCTISTAILQNPLINNEYLFKQMTNYVQQYNLAVKSTNFNSDILIEKEQLEKIAARGIISKCIQQVLGQISEIKKDRVLQRSMLGELYQWVEKMTNDFVDLHNDSFNPFQSIQDKNEFQALHHKFHEPEDQQQLAYHTPMNQEFQIKVNTNQQSQDALWAESTQQRSYQESELKERPFYMTFYKEKNQTVGSQGLIGGSIADQTTTIPQSERVQYNLTTQDRSIKQSNQNISIQIQEGSQKRKIMPLTTAELLFQEQSIRSDFELSKMVDESDNESLNQMDQMEAQALKGQNPFSNTNELRFPAIQNNPMYQTQTSVTSSYNYPNGIVYSANASKHQPNRLVKQYVPFREVPKMYDMTRDTILQLEGAENEDLQVASTSRATSQRAKAFVQGGMRQGAASQERRIPGRTLFQDYNASLNNYFSADPDDANADKDFFRKEKELNLLGQTAIFQLKELKPFQEIPLDKNQLAQQMQENQQQPKSSRRPKKDDENENIEDSILLKIKQMEQSIQQMSSTQSKYGAANYPFLQRGIEVEQHSQNEIEVIKKHMASIGLHIPINVLEKAIFIPKDLDAEGRKYPRIGDMLMKNLFKKHRASNGKRSRTNNSGRVSGAKSMGSDRLPQINSKLMKTGYSSNLYYKIT